MTEPPVPPISVAQRNHPRVECAECGRRLATGFPSGQSCPSCGGTRRHYHLGLFATLTSSGAAEAVRRYVEKRWRWLIVGIGLVAVGVVVSLTVGGSIGVVVGAALGVAGLIVPNWRTSVIERSRG